MLGFVHGAVGASDGGFLRLACCALGDAGAEGDQHLFVVVEEVFLGEAALQPGDDLRGLVERGVGQDDEEFLAAHSRDVVGEAQLFLGDLDQMDQRFVAGLVAALVVQRLEVVDVEHCDAEWGAVAVGARGLAREFVVQPAPVEAAGERVFAHQGAHLGELGFQFLDAAFGAQGGVAFLDQLLVGAHAVRLRRAGFFQQAFEDVVQFHHIFGVADAFDVGGDFPLVFVVCRHGIAHAANEGGHGGFQRGGGLAQAMLDHALLVDDFLEPFFGFLQRLDLAPGSVLPARALLRRQSHGVERELAAGGGRRWRDGEGDYVARKV